MADVVEVVQYGGNDPWSVGAVFGQDEANRDGRHLAYERALHNQK
jgi:hypothetical protein